MNIPIAKDSNDARFVDGLFAQDSVQISTICREERESEVSMKIKSFRRRSKKTFVTIEVAIGNERGQFLERIR